MERAQREEEEKRQKQAELVRESLPPEADAADAQNVCHIVFRLPGSGERVSRRFLKDQKIELLYMFIESISDKI